MEIKAKKIELVDIDSLVENPKNNNIHPPEQIERLAKIIKAHGFRNPLVVSNRSGFVLCGHGRIQAARELGIKKLPVIYQDFENEAEEYAHMTADNAIASWAKIDYSMVSEDIVELGPDFDIEMLGIVDFTIDPEEVDMPDLGDGSDPDIQKVTFTLSNEQKDILDEAMSMAKGRELWEDGVNKNKNGNILASILRAYVNS